MHVLQVEGHAVTVDANPFPLPPWFEMALVMSLKTVGTFYESVRVRRRMFRHAGVNVDRSKTLCIRCGSRCQGQGITFISFNDVHMHGRWRVCVSILFLWPSTSQMTFSFADAANHIHAFTPFFCHEVCSLVELRVVIVVVVVELAAWCIALLKSALHVFG